MSKHGITTGPGPLALALLAFALLVAASVHADDAAALYQTVVPMRSATEADRTAAFGEALRIVAVRVSGARDAGSQSDIAAAAANPARYVQQYAARSNHTLKVGFAPRAIEQLVLEAGLPVWPAERPATLVLLYLPAIGAASRAMLASEQAPERTELENAAEIRGIHLVWPVTEVASSAANDPERLRVLASAAGANAQSAVLVGVSQGGSVGWRYRPLQGETAERQGAAGEGAHLAADALAERYATQSTRNLARQVVVVAGVGDLGAYAEVLRYLGSLSLVRRVDVEEADGDRLHLGLTMRGDRTLLARIVELGNVLGIASATAGGVETDFVYSQ